MSLVPKIDSTEQVANPSDWQPTASLATLKKRADIINTIRQFFKERDVLEVDTPLLSHATVTDPYVFSIPAVFQPSGTHLEEPVYLQTSPEYAMKRLLAAGSGAIYQICKVFRQGDLGRIHNPEFTMLEWYRPGFDHHTLMNEMDELLCAVLNTSHAERFSYLEAFEKFVGINPHIAEINELKNCVQHHGINFVGDATERNFWLNLLLAHCIEPRIGQDRPAFLYDFPITQAALAKIRLEENPPVASRFEVYFKGVELANGFHELQNVMEQRARFKNDLQQRQREGTPIVPIDERFLAALEAGLPDCSGVALGVDRLVMLALQTQALEEVVSFAFPRA